MSDNNPSYLEDVQLTNDEERMDFTRFWTDERVKEAKLLAKKLTKTDLDAVEDDGLRAVRKPESVAVVEPTGRDERHRGGLPEPKKPKLHLEMSNLAGDPIHVFRMRDNSNYPRE